jgi:hypothetical protein
MFSLISFVDERNCAPDPAVSACLGFALEGNFDNKNQPDQTLYGVSLWNALFSWF